MSIFIPMEMTYSRSLMIRRNFKGLVNYFMRQSSVLPTKPKKRKGSDKEEPTHFVDYRKIRVIGGKGGDGMVALSSLPHNQWAGPDGGNGGNGGHVIFKVSQEVTSLANMKTLIIGQRGGKGQSRNCHGKSAKHLYVKVPINTVFKNENGEELTCLDCVEDYYIGAHGGTGGRGNYAFLSNENRAPVIAEEGADGEDRVLHLEMRVMAHAGLIGFPNAGKSTLLRALSRARPKVAAYPFTTLNPHIGMVQYSDSEQVAVADIPGLVKGSHEDKGLGFSFLRHVERCLCLLYVLDMSEEKPWQQLKYLKEELEHYSPGLSERPHAVVGNKMDLVQSQENLLEMEQQVDLPVIPVSAMKRMGIERLQVHLREMYDEYNLSKSL